MGVLSARRRGYGGYHAAKDEQRQIEARIITLQHILETTHVGGPPRTDGVVGPGMTVTVRFVGGRRGDDVPARLPGPLHMIVGESE